MTSHPKPPVHATLHHDHTELEQLFGRLEDAVEGADDPTIQRLWTEFERRLFAHLEGEERYLLPALALRHPAAVARIHREHRQIRELVDDLGIRTDLHLLRKDAADALVETLRRHAAHEDRTLYAWAEEEIGDGPLRELLDFVRQARAERAA